MTSFFPDELLQNENANRGEEESAPPAEQASHSHTAIRREAGTGQW